MTQPVYDDHMFDTARALLAVLETNPDYEPDLTQDLEDCLKMLAALIPIASSEYRDEWEPAICDAFNAKRLEEARMCEPGPAYYRIARSTLLQEGDTINLGDVQLIETSWFEMATGSDENATLTVRLTPNSAVMKLYGPDDEKPPTPSFDDFRGKIEKLGDGD